LGIGFFVNVWQRLEDLTSQESERLYIGMNLTYDF
jgi:hypothetical protein